MKRHSTASFAPPVLVDAHVHFHSCFAERTFLDAAARNFALAGTRLGLDSPPLGVLLFTESAGENAFRRFHAEAGDRLPAGWQFLRTGESLSLLAVRDGEIRLLLVAGRQVVTSERLEILALGCDSDIPDGSTFERALRDVRRAEALPVLPWGLGKWWFRRGRIAADIVERQDPGDFFLGDNAGRPYGSPRPALFARAESRRIKILPGTDPFPFPDHVGRAGSYGFVLAHALGRETPAQDLKAALRSDDAQLRPYGRGEALFGFVRDQLAMQLRRRRAGARA